MGLEAGTFISDFVPANPPDSDPANELDEHLRLIKSFVTATFPGEPGDTYDKAVTATGAQLASWNARLDTLEAAPVTLSSPASGFVVMSTNQTHPVTGLGFQPSSIIAYCIDYWSDSTSSYHTMGVTSWAAAQPDIAMAVTAIGEANALATVTDLATTFLGTIFPAGSTRTDVVISNVNSNGFDLSFNAFGGGARVLYLAFQ